MTAGSGKRDFAEGDVVVCNNLAPERYVGKRGKIAAVESDGHVIVKFENRKRNQLVWGNYLDKFPPPPGT